MKQISLTRGQIAIVDDADFERLTIHRWQFRDGFAMRSVRRKMAEGGGTEKIRMHRQILGTTERVKVEHINGNRLDNRRQNLRTASR